MTKKELQEDLAELENFTNYMARTHAACTAVCEREKEVKQREEKVTAREKEVEWAWEQQEAVLVEANKKGIELAGAVIEQRALMGREKKT